MGYTTRSRWGRTSVVLECRAKSPPTCRGTHPLDWTIPGSQCSYRHVDVRSKRYTRTRESSLGADTAKACRWNDNGKSCSFAQLGYYRRHAQTRTRSHVDQERMARCVVGCYLFLSSNNGGTTMATASSYATGFFFKPRRFRGAPVLNVALFWIPFLLRRDREKCC